MPGDTSASSLLAPPPPIPKSGPLAQPPSNQAMGLPNDKTLAAIPPDNPQTAERSRAAEALLRRQAVGRRNRGLRHLPRSPARVHRRPADLHRGTGSPRPAQLATVLNALYTRRSLGRSSEDPRGSGGLPITNPVEMGQPDLEAAVASARGPPRSTSRPLGACFRPPNAQDLVRALARMNAL